MAVNKQTAQKDQNGPVLLKSTTTLDGLTTQPDGYRLVLKCNHENRVNSDKPAQTGRRL